MGERRTEMGRQGDGEKRRMDASRHFSLSPCHPFSHSLDPHKVRTRRFK